MFCIIPREAAGSLQRINVPPLNMIFKGFLPIPVHALAELVDDGLDALLVFAALLRPCLEHLAEQIVIGVSSAPLRRFLRFGPALPRLRLLRLSAGDALSTLSALQHLLEDFSERAVSKRILRPPLRR